MECIFLEFWQHSACTPAYVQGSKSYAPAVRRQRAPAKIKSVLSVYSSSSGSILGMYCVGMYCVSMYCVGMYYVGMYCVGMYYVGMYCVGIV